MFLAELKDGLSKVYLPNFVCVGISRELIVEKKGLYKKRGESVVVAGSLISKEGTEK